MKFENAFVVQAPIDEVWGVVLDVERVAPCMPGAQVLERLEGDAYKVGIRVKLGPMSMQYRGRVEITDRDDATHTATMRARAQEARGQGTADAQVRMSLADVDGGTRGTIETDLSLSGRAAAMGQGVITDVSARLVEQFAQNLSGLVTAPAAAPPEEQEAHPVQEAAPSEPARPSPPPISPADSDALPVADLAASVIAGRLRDPRTLALAVGAVAAVFTGLGYAIGSRSR